MLKTDYKNAMWEGAKKYRITSNPDGTSGISDATRYTQEGDLYGAEAINESNREINRLGNTVVVRLPASGWSSEAPYKQTVTIPGIKESDQPEIHAYLPEELDGKAIKLRKKLTDMITGGNSGNGAMTFRCGIKKPTEDFEVLLTGVSIQEGGMA